MKRQPIHVGDCLVDHQGNEWKVITCLPGGRLDLFDKVRCYFFSTYHRHVKDWKRPERKDVVE